MSKKAVLKKLKPCNCTGEAKNITIKNAMSRKEELGDVDAEESEHQFPTFTIIQRNNFYQIAL